MTQKHDEVPEAMARILEGKEGFANIAPMGPRAALKHTPVQREGSFDFAESFKRSLDDFDGLPESSKADYYRSQKKDSTAHQYLSKPTGSLITFRADGTVKFADHLTPAEGSKAAWALLMEIAAKHNASVTAPDARQEGWNAGIEAAASLIRRVADGYEAGGDAAIATGLRLTEGNVRALKKGQTND